MPLLKKNRAFILDLIIGFVLQKIKPEVFGVLFLFGHALSLKGLNALEVRHLPEYKIEEPFSLTEIYGTGLDKCKFCVQFAEQATSSILNIILNVVVVGGCSDLCGALTEKTGSETLGVACSILCDIVGSDVFVDVIRKADPNPIYLCELIPVCPVNDHGDATITKLTVTPSLGPRGLFEISYVYFSHNGTGTGELALETDTLEGIPIVNHFLHEAVPSGSYMGSFLLKAVPDPNIDPYHRWLPGIYNVTMGICNGECGSKHPHSSVYDRKRTHFTITD